MGGSPWRDARHRGSGPPACRLHLQHLLRFIEEELQVGWLAYKASLHQTQPRNHRTVTEQQGTTPMNTFLLLDGHPHLIRPSIIRIIPPTFGYSGWHGWQAGGSKI